MSQGKKIRYSSLNRKRRRELEKQHPDENVHPDPTLSEYMKHPGLVVKRSELFGVVDKLIRLHEMKRKRDRWYNRLSRWLNV